MKQINAIIGLVIMSLLVAGSYEAAATWFSPQPNPPATFDPTNEILAACNYLLTNYNSSLGLVAETPAHQKYWLYSDNLVVSATLQDGCDPSVSAAFGELSYHIWSHVLGPEQYPNQYLVLRDKVWDFNASRDYNINGSVWATINNQTGTLSPDDYADIAFLQAIYFTECCPVNTAQAELLFYQSVDKYNGTGFIDKAFQGQFQTYKLALYIYLARILHRPFLSNALATLLRMQDQNGGFHTGYVSDYSTDGTSVNTETTCLAILALASLKWPSTIGRLSL